MLRDGLSGDTKNDYQLVKATGRQPDTQYTGMYVQSNRLVGVYRFTTATRRNAKQQASSQVLGDGSTYNKKTWGPKLNIIPPQRRSPGLKQVQNLTAQLLGGRSTERSTYYMDQNSRAL